MWLNMIILGALVQLNRECSGPWPATIGYGVAGFILGIAFGVNVFILLAVALLNTGIGFGYFWLLKKTERQTEWWAVMILGIVFLGGLNIVM